MKREIYDRLLKWKDSKRRKPLMMYGARQVGNDNAGSGLKGYRFSMLGYDDQDWMSNIPLVAGEPYLKGRMEER